MMKSRYVVISASLLRRDFAELLARFAHPTNNGVNGNGLVTTAVTGQEVKLNTWLSYTICSTSKRCVYLELKIKIRNLSEIANVTDLIYILRVIGLDEKNAISSAVKQLTCVECGEIMSLPGKTCLECGCTQFETTYSLLSV